MSQTKSEEKKKCTEHLQEFLWGVAPVVWDVYSQSRTGQAQNCQVTVLSTQDASGVMAMSAGLEKLQVSPLHENPNKGAVPQFRWHDWTVCGQSFKSTVHVVDGDLWAERKEVKELEEGKRNAGLNKFLQGWIEPLSKKLEVVGDGLHAAAIFNQDIMDSIGVNDPQAQVSSYWC